MWLGLIQLATAPDLIPAWRSRSRRQRLAVYAGLGLVTLVLVVDPASLRAMITGWYRGRFPSHD